MSETQQLWQFDGGLKLKSQKDISTRNSIVKCKASKRYTVPLQQHIGKTAEPVVAIGETVKKGQMIAQPVTVFSAAAHSPVSGRVVDIGLYSTPHPSGLKSECIVIENDFKDERYGRDSVGNFFEVMTSHDLRQLVSDAGIVGLGGAGFPTAIKQTEIDIHTLILNGAECEPYITCDDALMREYAEEIISGAEIIAHIIKARECIIAIEDNKPEAIAAIQQVADNDGTDFFRVQIVPTIYPSGGEKQLIKIITGKEVPLNGLPADIDVLCQNVATAYAIHNAVHKDEPLISRIVTITGDGIEKPQNMEVLIGTNMSECVEQCGGYKQEATSLIVGGPMMGFALKDDQAPITKASNCLLISTENEIAKPQPSQMPCIRCGHCVDVCPARLLPQQLYWYASSHNFERIKEYRLSDCIECGCCSYVCPSKIPLVQYYRYAKAEIRKIKFDTNDSDTARQRYEDRNIRLENIKLEREQRLQRKRELLKNKSSDNNKQKVIEEALARVAAKKAVTSTTDNK